MQYLTKREIARQILLTTFADKDRVTIAEVVKTAGKVGVSRRTLTRAAHDLGVTEVHNGPYGAFWQLEEAA